MCSVVNSHALHDFVLFVVCNTTGAYISDANIGTFLLIRANQIVPKTPNNQPNLAMSVN